MPASSKNRKPKKTHKKQEVAQQPKKQRSIDYCLKEFETEMINIWFGSAKFNFYDLR